MKLPSSPPLPTTTMTIPRLARAVGMARRTLYRRLAAMHKADRARGGEHALWLHRPPEGPATVNLARLRLEHPEMFGVPSPEELHEQLVEVRQHGVQTRKMVNALGAAFREYRVRGQASP